jgi:hypothetical protein
LQTCQVPTCRSETCVVEQEEQVCGTCSNCNIC